VDSTNEPWAVHVHSFLNTLRYELMAVRLMAWDGISVADGRRYAPLPEAEALEVVLTRFEEIINEIDSQVQVSGAPGTSAPEPEEATRFALRIRIGFIAGQLSRNLSPEEIGRAYTAVSGPAARLLSNALPALEKLACDARQLLARKETDE